MNLRYCLSALLLLPWGILSAQITITNTDMPRVNDTLRYSTATAPAGYVATDTNFIWNFSGMKAINQDICHYYAPSQTPYFLQFLLTATYGLPENNIAMGPGGGFASDVYSFYKTATSALTVVGRGATIQGLPLGITYSKKDTIYKYPLTYGKTWTGSYQGEAGVAGLGTLKQTGTRNTIVDGWGTIITPYDTFDCIRIKSTVTGYDSVVFNNLGLPFPVDRTEYTWLAKNERFPILEVIVNNTTSTVVSCRFKDRYRPEAYVSNCSFRADKTLAAPGDTISFTNNSFGNPKSFNWQITPSTWHFASGSSATSEFPKVIFDALGNYSVKLSVTYEGGADDTLRTDYIKIREAVKAGFFASQTRPSPGETVLLTDTSLGSPIAWQWTITPSANVTFVNGTSMISQNPQVQFTAAGNYDVQLRITAAGGSNTYKATAYIQVVPTGLEGLTFNNTILLYPNPSNQFFFAESKSQHKGEMKILDINGRLILEKLIEPMSISKIETSGLYPGIYTVQWIENEKLSYMKICIE